MKNEIQNTVNSRMDLEFIKIIKLSRLASIFMIIVAPLGIMLGGAAYSSMLSFMSIALIPLGIIMLMA